jgi:hypothetical protein
MKRTVRSLARSLVVTIIFATGAGAQSDIRNVNVILTGANFQTGCDVGAWIDASDCASLESAPISGPAFLWIVVSSDNGFEGGTGPYGIGGVQFGLEHDLDIDMWASCTGGLEIPSATWPASGSGNAVTWTGDQCYVPAGDNARIGYLALPTGDVGQISLVPDPRTGELALTDCGQHMFAICPGNAGSADLSVGTVPECEDHPLSPAPPVDVIATTDGCDIQLAWSWAGTDASYFEVYRDGAHVATVDIEDRTFTDTTLPEGGGTFSYVVRATAACGGFGASAPTGGTTPSMAPATDCVASDDACGRIDVSWTDQSTGELGFQVVRNGAVLTTVGPDVTTYTDTAALANVPYDYRIVVLGPCGRGTSSNTDGGLRLSPPVAPSLLYASEGLCNLVELEWNEPSGNTDAVHLLRDDAVLATLPPETTSYDDTDVVPGQTYTYAVEVVSPCGADTSAARTGTPADGPPPAPVECVATDEECGLVRVTWVDQSADELGFHVWRDGATIATVDPDVTEYVDTSAPPSEPHLYSVSAFTDCGESATSNEDEGTLHPDDSPVSPIVLESPDDAAECLLPPVTLTWRADPNAVLYQWVIYLECGVSIWTAGQTSDTTVTVPLAQGTYDWRVQGRNACGTWGDWSSCRTFEARPPLEAPYLYVHVDYDGELRVQWEPIPGAVHYEVAMHEYTEPNVDPCYVYDSETLIWTMTSTDTLLNVDDLPFDDEWVTWVTAFDTCDRPGLPSECTPPAYPVPVVLDYFRVRPDPTGVIAEWATGSEREIDGFILYRESDAEPIRAVNETPVPAGEGVYALRDDAATHGETYTYILHEVNDRGVEAELARAAITVPEPAARTLALRARPNPFNPRVTLAFEVPHPSHVVLDVLDSAGRIIRRIVDGTRPTGAHRAVWEGRDAAGRPVASGVYFVRLQADGARTTRSITLLR